MRRWGLTMSVVASIGIGLMLVGDAAAAPPARVAVLGVRAPKAPAGLREKVEAAVAAGLAASGVEVVDAVETARRVATRPELVGCETTTCLVGVGEVTGAPTLVRGWLETVDTTYALRLDMVEAATGTSLGVEDDRCENCAADQLQETARLAVARLYTNALGGRAAPSSAVAPAAAQPDAAGGQHPPGAAPPASVATSPVAAGAPAGRATSGTWPWIAVGVGAVTMGAGVFLLGMDGDGTCTPPKDGAQCPKIYDTTAGGITLLTVGVAFASVGAFVLVFGTEGESEETKVTVGPTGAWIGRRF